MEDLVKQIDLLVEKKTFNLDALDAIKALRTTAEEQEKKINFLESYKKEHLVTIARLENAVRKKDEEILALTKREAEIENRERNVFNLEKQTAVSNAVSDAYKDIFGKMFVNRQFREVIVDSATKPIPTGNGYPTIMNESSTKTTTREEV